MRLVARVVVACLLFVSAMPAAAQQRAAAGAIDGVVTDSNLVALSGATASIVGTGIHVATGDNGRFRIVALPVGEYIVMVRRVGYTPVSALVDVAERDTARMSFTLQRSVALLDTVVVAGQRASFRLSEFEDRRAHGGGQYMTRDQIEKRGSVYVPDLLRTFMSVSVSSAGVATNNRAGITKPCPFQYFIDGVRIPTPRSVNELPSPTEIAGIEVYANSATIPLQYRTFGGDGSMSSSGGFCGVILLWTRGG